MTICKACGYQNESETGVCQACADGPSGEALPGSDAFASHIAAAESRLAAIGQHLAELEAEAAAIAESLASARRVSVPGEALAPRKLAPGPAAPPFARSPQQSPPSTRAETAARARRASVLRPLVFIAAAFGVIALLAFVAWPRSKPAPAIAEFSSDRASIQGGTTARICVRATGATFLAVAPGVGALPAEGEHCITVAPATTTTYTAVATGSAGGEAQDTLTVAVVGAPQRPLEIRAFTASPSRIVAGTSTRVCYDVTGAQMLRIVPKLGNPVRLRSCQTITLDEPHSYVYHLVAWGDNGQVAMRRTRIDVVAAAPPRPAPTAAPQISRDAAPTQAVVRNPARVAAKSDGSLARRAVYQFDATPAIVERGQAASLCVGVGRWAQGDVTAIGTLEPGITRCYRVKPVETTVYRLHVALDKSVAYETVTVAVRPPGRGRSSIQSRQGL